MAALYSENSSDSHYCMHIGCGKGGVNGNYIEDGKEKHLLMCAGCGDKWYCSKEHQKADWKEHKGYCKSKAKNDQVQQQKGNRPIMNFEMIYDEYKERSNVANICISQSYLFGSKIRSHVLFCTMREIAGGGVVFMQKPIAATIANFTKDMQEGWDLKSCANQSLVDPKYAVLPAKTFDSMAVQIRSGVDQFWAMCPTKHRSDRIAVICWLFLPAPDYTSPAISLKLQMLGSGEGARCPLDAPLDDSRMQVMLKNINDTEIARATAVGSGSITNPLAY
jgi:hypothetical protein